MININVAFRVDASVKIGIGHVMRTLTLANILAENGATCLFICRCLPSHLRKLMLDKGHSVHILSKTPNNLQSVDVNLGWLAPSQIEDARETASVLSDKNWDWIVIDHYGIDRLWEQELSSFCNQIMVIDDLADRYHYCHILLDQTLFRQVSDYHNLVPSNCRLFLGAKYALLRPEFNEMRSESIQRRSSASLNRILISFGGTDSENVTGKVISMLDKHRLLSCYAFDIVLGSSAPFLNEVRSQVKRLGMGMRLMVDVDNMASLIANSDLVIGAAGTTSWERCCLGAPTLIAVLAENQRLIAQAVSSSGAAVNLGSPSSDYFYSDLISAIDHLISSENLKNMSEKASAVTNGDGARVIASQILNASLQ